MASSEGLVHRLWFAHTGSTDLAVFGESPTPGPFVGVVYTILGFTTTEGALGDVTGLPVADSWRRRSGVVSVGKGFSSAYGRAAVPGSGTKVLGLGGALGFFFGTSGVSPVFSFQRKADSESLSTGLGVTRPVGRGTGTGAAAVAVVAGATGVPNKPPWAKPRPEPAGAAAVVEVPNSPPVVVEGVVVVPNNPPVVVEGVVVLVPNKPPPAAGVVEVPNNPPVVEGVVVDVPNKPPPVVVVVEVPNKPPPVDGWAVVDVPNKPPPVEGVVVLVPKRPPPVLG